MHSNISQSFEYSNSLLLNKYEFIQYKAKQAIVCFIECIIFYRRELGVVLESEGEFDTAAECLITSINLEQSTPVIPFHNLLRVG